MKVSAMIAQLQRLMAEHGDLEVAEYNEDDSAWQLVDGVSLGTNVKVENLMFDKAILIMEAP